MTHYDTFSEAAKMSWALRGGCGLCGDLRQRFEAILLQIPGAGSLDLRLPSVGILHRSFPVASLESAASVVRARGLRAIIKENLNLSKMGLVISKQIGYTVYSEITKRLFPACCNRRFGNGRFLIAWSIRWCFAPSMPSNSPS